MLNSNDKIRIAFGTVVYKAAYNYYPEFIESLNKQDYVPFDILLLNDDLEDDETNKLSDSCKAIVWEGTKHSKPSDLRVELIKKAKEKNYDLLILGDFDDTFSSNRVSQLAKGYDKSFSFYYNDIYCFNKKKKFFNNLPKHVKSISNILEHNYLGLSNTALNLQNFDMEIIEKLKNVNTSIFDWYMYSILLAEGHKGKKVESCKTYYRIHEHNIAGESGSKFADINREIDVKIKHYSSLRNVNINFSYLFGYYTKLKSKLANNECDILGQIDKKCEYWWGRLKSNKIRFGE